jgi:hypothetical protein
MVLEPQLHHGRPISPIPVQLLPSRGFIQLLHSDEMLANWLILPLEGRSVHFSPEGERNLELKEVILLLAECFNENVGVIGFHCFILEGRAA